MIAQPPHKFTNPARGLLISWLAIWFGAITLCFMWGGFIIPVLYCKSIESYEKGWDGEHGGWWGRYVKVEKAIGRAEHKTYVLAKGVLGKVVGRERRQKRKGAEGASNA